MNEKSTFAFGSPARARAEVKSATATIVGGPGRVELDATIAAPARPAPSALASAARTTVLPRRVAKDQAETVMHPRFDRVDQLGKGAMGEVALVRDNDIRRTVAVKYLRSEIASDEGALLRFADEVRVVGQLEHPSIVPVYDVGVDEAGQHFIVMKHLQGETMEAIIEKLRAGDAAAVARFTPEHRAHLFLQILEAIRYAHARGVIHRDIKPANIMIGPYGEVTMMDWGIAKPIGASDDEAPAVDAPRLLETQAGALTGTPLYMSPEQAMGRGDLDERSDVYTLCVVLYEWLVLEHPLHDKTSMVEILAAIALQDYDERKLKLTALAAGIPCELAFLAVRGMKRDREARYRSVDELARALREALAGKIDVECHITLAKRSTREVLHWIDRHPLLYTGLFGAGVLALLAGIVASIALAVGG